MSAENELDLNTLVWVKSEIDETLKQARKALEVFVEDESDNAQIQFCLNYLHQVRGTLQMVELYGSAMAAEEMENLVQALIDNKVGNRGDAFEVLIRGVLQLPDYLDHLLEGHPDTPMLLLPLLNDLRAARGAPLLSENALFTPDLTVEAPLPMTISGNLVDTLRKLRHHYHLGLLDWFRDRDDEAGLKRIAGVLEELRKSASEQEISRLLWVADGLVESLVDGGLESSVSIKLLLGHLDRQFKKILDRGEHALNVEPPSELLKNLLYYVATSRGEGTLTREVKEAFRLDEILPDMGSLEQARADMAAPGAALMSTVSSVMMEDLLKVKDNLDLFVRSEERKLEDLLPLKDTLLQIADTLGMLGLGIQRENVQQQVETINAMESGERPIDDNSLMEMAGALLDLENSLNEINVARAANVRAEEGTVDAGTSLIQDAEHLKLLKTVVKEAKLELDQVKEAINLFSKNPADKSPLEIVPAALDRIKGGISILSLERAADLLQGCIGYIRENLLEGALVPDADTLDSLADAISSIEYYLESLAGKWGQPEAILDVAEYSLAQLQGEPSEQENDELVTLSGLAQPEMAEEPVGEPGDDNDTLIDLGMPETGGADRNDESITETMTLPEEVETDEDETLHDISIVDLKLPEETEAVAETETAESAGEGDEEQTLTLDIEGFDSADEVLPQATPEQAEAVEEAAEEEPAPAAEAVEVESGAAEQPAVMEEIDEEILEIFMEEAEEVLEQINEMLPKLRQDINDEDSLGELRRAFHTLKGSGRLVGAMDIGEFAWAFENMLNRVLDNTIELSEPMLDLIDQARQVLPAMFNLFREGRKPDAGMLVLMEYADRLRQGQPLPEAAAAQEEEEAPAPEETPPEETATEPAPEPAIDPVLLDIYRKEVETHLATLETYVRDWENGRYHAPTEALMRALHTLTGSSRTTGVMPVAELCGRFEHYVKELMNLGAQMDADALGLLNDCIDYIRAATRELEQGMPGEDSNQSLLARLQQLIDNIDTAPREAPAVAPEPAAEAPEAAQPAPEYDEDLLEIFIEEGDEILDASDTTLHHWQEHPDEQEDVEALQRYLHTLKGGARMAGVTPVGDLSHNIESLLTLVAEGRKVVSEDMFSVLQRAQDRLVQMLEQLKARQPVGEAADIIQAVEALIQGDAAPVAGAVEAPPVEEAEAAPDEPPADVAAAGSETAVAETEAPAEPGPESEPEPEPEAEAQAEEAPVAEETAEAESTPEVEPAGEPEAESAAEENAPQAPAEAAADNVLPFAGTETTVESAPASAPAREVTEAEERRKTPRKTAEQIRVRAELLDDLVNFAGEVSIYRSRMEQQSHSLSANLQELDETVTRLREQLRQFEIETETQIQYRREETVGKNYEDFDPLEFDRFTQMQHLSRAMMESLNDLDSLRNILAGINRESETLLLQQSRVNTELQEGLMRTRLVPFTGHAPRLRRIVRQTAEELGKKVRLELNGLENELDRTVMERVIPPLEHMLRNSVAHGIEAPAVREANGKPETGRIKLSFEREGTDIVISIADDGAGLDYDAIRRKAIDNGLLSPDAEVSKDILETLIMESGFSTAEEVSQIAGRGVGMDVVNAAIKQMGGMVEIESESGKGTTFILSLPLTLSISRALMVNVSDETYALPLLSVQGVERISPEEVSRLMNEEQAAYEWLGEEFRFMSLAQLLGLPPSTNEEGQKLPLLMVRSGDHRAAILVDNLIGSREVVVKPVGPQLGSLRGVAGATIMGDGSVVLVLDPGMLIRSTITREMRQAAPPEVEQGQQRLTVMVVDDSITVRKVTTRLLERNDYDVVAAKDGVDALGQLLEVRPDIMLLDIEMPRMDGFELATNMRNDEELRDIPIIMITSRTGEKHRDRALEIGVNKYMGKPFSEDELLENIRALTEK